MLRSFNLLICIVWSTAVYAGGKVTFENPFDQVWTNPECASGPCEVKEFSVRTQEYMADYTHEYGPGAYNYGTRAFIRYKTTDYKQLENYSVVQYLRGCRYATRPINDTQLEVTFHVVRRYFDELVVMKHPDWSIDSIDKDPMYNNTFPEEIGKFKAHNSRHSLYRTNAIEGSFDDKTEDYLGNRYPPFFNELYVVDRPGTAFVEGPGQFARNISLEFDACLYKTSDVPESWPTPMVRLPAKPVSCIGWRSSYVYNWKTLGYERPSAISKECAL